MSRGRDTKILKSFVNGYKMEPATMEKDSKKHLTRLVAATRQRDQLGWVADDGYSGIRTGI